MRVTRAGYYGHRDWIVRQLITGCARLVRAIRHHGYQWRETIISDVSQYCSNSKVIVVFHVKVERSNQFGNGGMCLGSEQGKAIICQIGADFPETVAGDEV